ncbi:MAG: hypothetical protein K0S42_3393, partial [Microvirga sp.]|nr:hypothetical protein [Microvirga sp.]
MSWLISVRLIILLSALISMAVGFSTSAKARCLPEPAYRENEPKALKGAKGRTLRDGWVLRVMTDAGPVDFADTDCKEGPADECVKYSLATILSEQNLWVIHVGYYEGASYKLVDMKTGQVTNIDGFPWFSPDRQRFVTATSDPHADTYTLAVWKVSK